MEEGEFLIRLATISAACAMQVATIFIALTALGSLVIGFGIGRQKVEDMKNG